MVRQGPISDSELSFADMVLADTNNNRNNLNERIRELHFGFIPESWCTLNEKMICRTNCIDNRSSDGFMLTNGTLGTVNEIKHQNQLKTRVEFISPDLGTFNSDITQTPWLFKRKVEPVPPLFELGYCLTVHLSQGSEWDNLIYDMGNRPNRRSLYTAITRAKQSLLISI
jgi:exodeoxyribonuclease-5